MSRPTVHLCIMVWGDPFVEKFARTTLACLLSPRNLPAIEGAWDVVAHAYTDRDSVPLLSRLLSPLGEVRFHLFDETIVRGRTLAEWMAARTGPAIKHELNLLTSTHAMETCLASGPDDVVVLTDNDFLVADGTLSTCLKKITDGAKACVFPVLRLMTSAPVVSLMGELTGEDGTHPGLTADRIVGLLPDALHPTTRSCLMSEPAFSTYPSLILWPVEETGILCRAFFPTPFVINPSPESLSSRKTADYDLALRTCPDPEAIYVPSTSSEGLICKVTNISYDGPALDRNGVSLGLLTHFVLGGTNRRHRELISKPMRIGPDNVPQAAWRAVEDLSLAQLTQVYDLVDTATEELPDDDPDVKAAKTAHFGSLDDFTAI